MQSQPLPRHRLPAFSIATLFALSLLVPSCAGLLSGKGKANWVEGTKRHQNLEPAIKSLFVGSHIMARNGYQPVKVAVVTEWEPQRNAATSVIERRLIGANVAFHNAAKNECTAAGVWFFQEHLGGGRYGALTEYSSFGARGTRVPDRGIAVRGGFGDDVECAKVMDARPARAAAGPPGELTSEQETKLREIGGDQLVTDARFVLGLDPKGKQGEYQAVQCFSKYLLAHKQSETGKMISAEGNYRSCVSFCKAAAKKNNPALTDLTTRFVEQCGKRQAVAGGSRHLERAVREIKKFASASGSFNWYYRNADASGALRQASEALGADNPDVAAAQAEYDAIYGPREAKIKAVAAFMNQPEIKSLVQKRRSLQDEIRGLESDAKWSEHAKAVLKRKKTELRETQRSFDSRMRAAKL